MTTQVWNQGTIGDWVTKANWTPQIVPTVGDDAIINAGTVTVSAADPVIRGVSILLGGLASGEAVTLHAVDAAFLGSGNPPEETDMVITVTGGDPVTSPLNARFLVEGKTRYDGQILVTAMGGTFTIDSEGDGTHPGKFIFDNVDEKAVMVVGEESVLAFTGDIIVNRGLIEILGGGEIAEGVTFTGDGIVALEDGGNLVIAGRVGAFQQIDFEDATGLVTLDNARGFHGIFGFTEIGGARIDLAGLQAQSVVFGPAPGEPIGVLRLYSEADGQGDLVAKLAMRSIDAESLAPVALDLTTADFTLSSDGDGGTLITYTPQNGVQLEQSLAVPIVASAGTMVSFASILENAFGTASPAFTSITLLPSKQFENTSTDVGYWEQPNITPTWYVNGVEVTTPTPVTDIRRVKLEVGNQIIDPASFQAVVSKETSGPRSVTISYNVWSVDPRVAQAVHDAGFGGLPTPRAVVASAVAFDQVFGQSQILNTSLCSWIGDNVAAGAGAAMPLPNSLLDPTLNVEGGFWRIVYTGASASPVSDWSTLVKPGDIVRMGWFKPETGAQSGHTTTVLAGVNANGEITVYDNGDFVNGQEFIGIHDANYWLKTDPVDITIYRLDPDQQYLIEGSALGEFIQGSVFNDLIQPGGGGDTITGGPGGNEIQDTTANLDGDTVTDFGTGDRLDFTDLDPVLAQLSYKDGILTVSDGTHSSSLTLPGAANQVFVLTPDGEGGSFVDRLGKTAIAGTLPMGYVLDPAIGRLVIADGAVIGGSGVTTTSAHASIVANLGTVLADDAAIGLVLNGGGLLTNGSRADPLASIHGGTGVVVKGFGVVTNFGIIGSTTGGRALVFNSPDSRLVQQGGGVLDGTVNGGGGTLELARDAGPGTLAGLGTLIKNFGAVQIDKAATWTLAGPASIAAGTTLGNAGMLTLTGQLANSGAVENLAGGTLDLRGDFGIGKVGQFTNAGTLLKSAGTGVSLIRAGGMLFSGGRIVVETGTLELAGSLLTIAGPISGAGTIAFGPGITQLIEHASIATSGLTITGKNAELWVDRDLDYAGSFSSGPATTLQVNLDESLKLDGPASFDRGTVSGFGRLVTEGATTLHSVALGQAALWRNDGTLTGTGTLSLTGSAMFANRESGVFNLQGKVDITAASVNNLLVNRGLLAKGGGSGSTISAPLVNAGIVEVVDGRLTITGAISGHGTLQIDADQTLAIDGAVASGQKVMLGGGSERLMLGDAVNFAGKLVGFGAGDKLDFTQFDPSTATVAFAERKHDTFGTLTIADATHRASILLLGQYAASGFHAASDGHGGTLVTYAPPPEADLKLAVSPV